MLCPLVLCTVPQAPANYLRGRPAVRIFTISILRYQHRLARDDADVSLLRFISAQVGVVFDLFSRWDFILTHFDVNCKGLYCIHVFVIVLLTNIF